MIRSGFRNQTVGQLLTNLLCPFLQNGFAVIKELLRLKIGQDPLVDVSFGLFKTAIQINGAKHGLHDIRNDGISLSSSGCLFPLAKKDILLQGNVSGAIGKCRLTNHGGTDSGKLSLLPLRVMLKKELA